MSNRSIRSSRSGRNHNSLVLWRWFDSHQIYSNESQKMLQLPVKWEVKIYKTKIVLIWAWRAVLFTQRSEKVPVQRLIFHRFWKPTLFPENGSQSKTMKKRCAIRSHSSIISVEKTDTQTVASQLRESLENINFAFVVAIVDNRNLCYCETVFESVSWIQTRPKLIETVLDQVEALPDRVPDVPVIQASPLRPERSLVSRRSDKEEQVCCSPLTPSDDVSERK